MNATIGPVQEKMAYCKKHHVDINRHMKFVPVPFFNRGQEHAHSYKRTSRI